MYWVYDIVGGRHWPTPVVGDLTIKLFKLVVLYFVQVLWRSLIYTVISEDVVLTFTGGEGGSGIV